MCASKTNVIYVLALMVTQSGTAAISFIKQYKADKMSLLHEAYGYLTGRIKKKKTLNVVSMQVEPRHLPFSRIATINPTDIDSSRVRSYGNPVRRCWLIAGLQYIRVVERNGNSVTC